MKTLLFSLENIQTNSSLLIFYTVFPNFQTMMALFEILDPCSNRENINYWLPGKETFKSNSDSEKLRKQGRPRFLQPLDEFFLTICRLRQGFAEQHLANLFHISQSTVSQIFITWIKFIILKLGKLCQVVFF